jgi:exopolysaccharide production protein ExoZ
MAERVTEAVQKFRSIQALRALAACAVAFLHCYQVVGAPTGIEGYGAFGVDLFFVISGFIMAQVAGRRTAGEFLRDRLWRIYPMWWIALLPWLILLPRGVEEIGTSLSLWPIIHGEHFVPILQVGWTLSFELLFYAAVTLAILSRLWIPLLAFGALMVGALFTHSALLHFLGNPIALEFLLGVIVARLPRRMTYAAMGLAGMALLAFTAPTTGSARETLADPWFALARVGQWGIPAAMILWGALSLEPVFASARFDALVLAGDASYSIYLVHPLVAYGLVAPWPVKLAAAILVGIALHLTVERRLMTLTRRGRRPMKRFATV